MLEGQYNRLLDQWSIQRRRLTSFRNILLNYYDLAQKRKSDMALIIRLYLSNLKTLVDRTNFFKPMLREGFTRCYTFNIETKRRVDEMQKLIDFVMAQFRE